MVLGCSKKLTPEGHADARDGVERVEAANGVFATRLPEGNLSLAHPGEARGRNAVVLAHPHGAAVLGSLMAGVLVHWRLLAHIPDTELLVSRGRDHQGAIGAPRKALYDVGVLERQDRLAGANVPQLDREVARSRGKNVFRRGVEEDLPNFSTRGQQSRQCELGVVCLPRVASELDGRRDVLDLFTRIGVKSKVLWYFPDKDLSVVGCRGNDAVVEGVPGSVLEKRGGESDLGGLGDVPVGVEDGCGVATEQRYLVGRLALLVEGDNGKGATTAGLPVHREIVGVRLEERRVSELDATASGEECRRRRRTLTRLVSQALRLM